MMGTWRSSARSAFSRLADKAEHKLEDRWLEAIYVGKLEKTDEHLGHTPDGTIKARSAQPRPKDKEYSLEFLAKCRGAPWNPKEEASRDHLGAKPMLGPGQIRSMYTTRAMIAQHGLSAGCLSCLGLGGQHSGFCRDRFEKLYGCRPVDQPEDALAPPAAAGDDQPVAAAAE